MKKITALSCALLGWSLTAPAQQLDALRVDSRRIESRLAALSQFGRVPGDGVNRIAFGPADIEAREYIVGQMQALGLEVRVDAAGNIIGRREGTEPGFPVIMFGSHIDSVPNGGRFDGNVGVIGALEVIDVLRGHAVETRHPLEVVVFTDEEGGLVGSRAMIGKLEKSALDAATHSGMTAREGIAAVGGNADDLTSARYRPEDLRAFIELHIEQGSVLVDEDIDIGIVEGIVGIGWWDVIAEGTANHAGTTPMNRRHDALLASAELIQAVNRIVTAEPGSQVGTVGRIAAEPGAPNVVPGRVVMSLELRDLNAKVIDRLFNRIRDEAKQIGERHEVRFRFEEIDIGAEPAPTDEDVRRAIAAVARGLGLSYRLMPSGAGHDAQGMAQITPTGMIFVPSEGGISHAPAEFTKTADLVNGTNTLLHTVLRIDGATP